MNSVFRELWLATQARDITECTIHWFAKHNGRARVITCQPLEKNSSSFDQIILLFSVVVVVVVVVECCCCCCCCCLSQAIHWSGKYNYSPQCRCIAVSDIYRTYSRSFSRAKKAAKHFFWCEDQVAVILCQWSIYVSLQNSSHHKTHSCAIFLFN